MTASEKPASGGMTVRGAASLGIGAMVGAGIFALLGEAGAVAGAATWLSFLLGGVIATLLGYVVAKLGARYPSSGGLVTFLTQGFGVGHLVGTFAWLLYFAAIIITAMVAVSFGSYAVALFIGEGASATAANLFTAGVIVVVAAVQILGADAISKIQSVVVVILLAVFAVFIAVTLGEMDTELLSPSLYPPGFRHRLQHRPHLLRLPRVRCHQLCRRGPARIRPATCPRPPISPSGSRPPSTS